jgi:DNA modification methylase
MKTNYTLIGDVREKLKELPDKSIQMCVTSPPYYALRDYGTAEWEGGDPNCDHKIGRDTRGGLSNIQKGSKGSFGDEVIKNNQKCPKCNAKRKDNQLGLEDTPEEFVANLVEVFAEVHRVLRDDGTLWLNLGDSYNSSQAGNKTWGDGVGANKNYDKSIPKKRNISKKLPPKSLMGIPWKVAIALQEWGWILRQDIIWAKKNCMPESVKDRFTKSHEYIFLFSKQPKYFFNQIREPATQVSIDRSKRKMNFRKITPDKTVYDEAQDPSRVVAADHMRNKRSVWNMRTASYKEAHFAVFPPELAETCIKAGSNENDIVLDCFMGSGTTAMVAQDLFRKWIGVELNPEYEKLIKKRTAQQVLF